MVVQFSDVPKLGNIFFTYKLENEEMHFSPEEVNTASEDKSTKSPFPFKGDNGIPQYFLPRAYQSEFYSRSVLGYQNNNHQYLDDAVLQTELQPIQNVTNHLNDTDIRDDTDLLTRSVNMSKSRRYHPIAPVHQFPKAKNEKQSSSNTSSYTSSRDYFTDADESEHHSDTSIGDFSDDKYYKESEERGITDQDQIIENLLSLSNQVKQCSDGFHAMKNRLNEIETTFSEKLKRLSKSNEMEVDRVEKELQTSYRMSSSPSLTSGVSSENELVLNVSNLEENFDKIQSYEARRLANKRTSGDQRRLSQLSVHFPNEDDIDIPHQPFLRLIPYYFTSWEV